MYRLRIAVDFDNCLVEKLEHPLRGYELKPYAKEVIEKYSQRNVEFVLNTSRYGRYLWSAVRFLKKQKLPIKISFTLSKVRADVYIDDHNIFCKDIDWKEIDLEIENMLLERS